MEVPSDASGARADGPGDERGSAAGPHAEDDAGEPRGQPPPGGQGGGSAERGCPLCAALEAWEAAGPEVRAHLRAAGRELALALNAAIDGLAHHHDGAGEDDDSTSAPGRDGDAHDAGDAPPGPAGWARRPGEPPRASEGDAPRLRRIDLE